MLKILIFFTAISLFAQELKVSGASIPTFDKKGKLESVMNCRSAIQQNGRIHMSGVEMFINDQNKTQMKTPKCQFLRFEKLIKGEDEIKLKSTEMTLHGRSFVYDLESKVLTIQKDVVIYLNPSKRNIK